MIGFWENWAKSVHFTGHYTYSVWIITVGHWIFAAQECLISNQTITGQLFSRPKRSDLVIIMHFEGVLFWHISLQFLPPLPLLQSSMLTTMVQSWHGHFFSSIFYYFFILTGHSSFLLSLLICALASSFSL